MRSRGFLFCLFVLLAHPVQGQEVRRAARDYEVPTYQALSWDIHGEDLFYYNDAGELAVNLGSDFLFEGQEPIQSYRVYNHFDFSYGGKKGERGHDLAEEFGASYQHFFFGSRGLSVRLAFDTIVGHANGDGQAEQRDLNLLGSAGLYYGRVVNARTVAQAAAMCEVAGQTCDAAELHRIAEIIGRAEANFYVTRFKYDADVEFYKDLAAAVGTDQPFKLRQVLTSPIYRISDRWVGWEIGVDLNLASGDHGDDDADAAPGQDLFLRERARYATLFTDDVNFWVMQEFLHGMLQTAAVGLLEHPGERMSLVRLEAGLNWDISYSWNFGTVVFGNVSFHNSGEYHSNYGVHVETNYALGSRFLAGIAGNLCNGDTALGADRDLMEICAGDKEVHYDIMAHFRVYIF